ncbi:MAG: lytic transglycosylase domain-containing protein [Deltaproteobacteria bacterium]
MAKTILFILIVLGAFTAFDYYRSARIEKVDIDREEISKLIQSSAPRLGSRKVNDLARLIHEECSKYDDIDPLLVLAIIQVESNFLSRAVSPKGAIGLMQVMPETKDYLIRKLDFDKDAFGYSLFDPEFNVLVGISYLGLLIERFGDIEMSLMAYNYGPNRTAEIMKYRSDFPSYVRRVLEAREQIRIKYQSL